MQAGRLRLAHGWTLRHGEGLSPTLLHDFIRPAVHAVPSALAMRLGPCEISFPAQAEGDVLSRWSMTNSGVEVSVATEGLEEHDVVMELLLCLGQAAWEELSDAELRAYWHLLCDEIDADIEGEIDEQALEEKDALLECQSHAGRARRLASYGRASFAGTLAEYVHCLWHEVTIRTGKEHLPAAQLKRRLELLAEWFPPDRGYHLFPSDRR